MLAAGDVIKFPMWRMSSGCLAPYVEGNNPPNGDAKLEMVDGEVIGRDLEVITIKFFCEKCNRYYETSIMMLENKGT